MADGGALRRVYPNKGRIMLDGGLNNKFEKTIILDNESPDCLNVVYSAGSVGTREGAQKLNTSSVGTFIIDGIYSRRANDNSETMVVFAGGSAWQLATTTFSTIGSAQSVFTAGFRVGADTAENYLFAGNGGVIPYKWDGSVWSRHGVYPTTTTSTVASQATGVLTGDYRYKVTNVNTALVESDVGPVSTTFTAASATLRVSLPLAATSHGVNARRIYRNTIAAPTVYKRVAEVSDNSTTSYDDNIADASLGTTPPTDNGVPPKYSAIIYHQNRLWMNDPDNLNFVWYTELAQPYTVASTNFLRVGDKTSDLVRGFGVHDNGVLVFCDKSIWLIYMEDTTPSNWTVVRVRSSHGSKSPYGITTFDNKVFFPAVQNHKFVGFGVISGNSAEADKTLLTVSASGSELKSQRIEPDMFLVQEAYLKNISSVVFKNKVYASLTYDSGNTTNNRIYVFDFSTENLTKDNVASWIPWTGLNASMLCVYNGSLYYGSSTATGFVYKLETGVYNDDGSAINSYAWTKEFSGFGEDTDRHKDWRYISMLIDNAGDYFMNLTYKVDSDKGSGNDIQVDLDPGGSLWGSMVWGRDNWGGGTYQEEERIFLANARGKRIQFKFSNQNTVNQRFKVHGIRMAYNIKGFR